MKRLLPVFWLLGTVGLGLSSQEAQAQDYCIVFFDQDGAVTEGTNNRALVVAKEWAGACTANDFTTPVSFTYATSSGSATSGSDFTDTSGSTASATGNQFISVPTNADLLHEGTSETYTLSITGSTSVGTLQGGLPGAVTFTINDGDAAPTVQLPATTTQTVAEGAAPTVTASLSHQSVFTVTAPFTLGGTATAGAGSDYTASPTASFSFAPLATASVLTLTSNDDVIDEFDETITVTLGAPTNATLGAVTSHEVTLTDNDALPNVSFTSAAQSEQESVGTMTVTATMDRLSEKGVTVPYTLGGSATEGAGDDYTITASPLSFGSTSTSEDITITVNDDGADENNEDVVITMGAPTNAATFGTTVHTATIEDNDIPQVDFTLASSSGDESILTPSLAITISPVPVSNITLGISYAGTATGGDYSASATLLVSAGSPTASLPLTIVNDIFDEADETIIATISSGTGYQAAGQTSHTYTILDDDADLAVSKSAGATFDPDAGTLTYTIGLTNTSATTDATGVTVQDLKLTAGDYASVTSTEFGAGTDWTGISVGQGATVNATVAATLNVEHSITNTATITAAGQSDDDGTNDSVTITVNQYDYGDVPATFNTGSKAARHEILLGGPVLGASVDSDSGNQDSATAVGDNGDADGDDEDGIATLPSFFALGATENLTVAVTGAVGTIHAWVDYNGDGDFSEANEFEGAVAAVVGNNTVSITPPSGSVSMTFLRLRLCTTASECDNPEELAADGEVEDYEIMIVGMDFGDADGTIYDTKFADDGARHQVAGTITHRLGAQIDADLGAQDNANATGDDSNGLDDEDGITFLTTLVDPATGTSDASIDVSALGTGVLYAWLDMNGSGGFDDATEEVITGAAVGATSITTVLFSIPSTATSPLTTYMRFRFCSAATTCDTPTGYATDGEVEDYEVQLVAASASTDATVQLPSGANVGATFTLSRNGTSLLLSDGALDLFKVPDIAGLQTLTINGRDASDLVIMDFTGGDLIPASGFTFNAGAGADELRLDLADVVLVATKSITYNGDDPTTGTGDFLTIGNSAGAEFYGFLSTHVDEDSGTFIVDDDVTSMPSDYDDLVITYDGLEPIFFTATPTDAEFHFNDDANSIILNADGDAGGAGNGFSFIDCITCGESVTFVTPTDSLIVRPGAGDDTITFTGLDVAAAVTLGVLIEGDAGADRFIVTPSPFYDPHIDGEDPVLPLCYGDILDIVTEGGITDHSLVYTSIGNGRWEFTGGSNDLVTFQSIESQLDARTDISVQVTASGTQFYPTDPVTLTYSVSNTGFEHATCVGVDINLPDAVNPTSAIVPDRGLFYDDTIPTLSLPTRTVEKMWLIPWLQSGVTATMNVDGIMDAHIQDTFLAAASGIVPATGDDPPGLVISVDSIEVNDADSVFISLLPTFPFPAKGHGISALQVNLPNGLERVLVGLAQGSPGLNTGVLCRIPDPDGVLFTQVGVGDRWRPCGAGLPHPIYVNDLFLDSRGTPADSTDDRVWLASWGSDGLYYSDDFGVTFESAAALLPGENPGWATVYAIAEDASGILYISANSGTVYRSFNRGDSWQKVKTLPGGSADTPWSLTSHPTEAGVLYAGLFGGGVYHTDDYGFSWEPLGGEQVNRLLLMEDAGHVFDLQFSPDSAEYLFAATGRGVHRIRLESSGGIAGLWDQISLTVTLDDGSVVVPEIRTIAFDPDLGDPDDNLLVGSWGFGAFLHEAPLTMPGASFVELALRGSDAEITVLLPLSSGGVLVGTKGGGVEIIADAAVMVSTASEEEAVSLPTAYALSQNYPNPFNPVTTIGFDLPTSGSIRLAVYDVLGREVAVLVDRHMEAGRQQMRFDATNLPSGSYLYRLDTDKGSFTRQLVLMK